jgi:hypothetical protein
MTHLWLLAALLAGQAGQAPLAQTAGDAAMPNAQTSKAIKEIAESGRCSAVAETPSERVNPSVRISPGLPPLLSFRYYEGKTRHRFGNTDLVLDDAGH